MSPSKKRKKKSPLKYAQQARKRLATLTIPLPRRVRKMRMVMPNFDNLSTASLTKLMSRWSQFYGYVKAQLALAEIRHGESAERSDMWEARLFVQYREENPDATVTDLRAMVKDHRAMRKWRDRTMLYDAKRRLLQAVFDGADQNYKMLSRELTRRTSSLERKGIE